MAVEQQLITNKLIPLILPDPLPPFIINLINLSTKSVIINVGLAPGPISIMDDFSCAMPSRTTSTPPSSTALSMTSSSSLSLSAKLSKRYQLQIFLSLDLPPQASGGKAEYLLLPLEKALIGALDPLYRPSSGLKK